MGKVHTVGASEGRRADWEGQEGSFGVRVKFYVLMGVWVTLMCQTQQKCTGDVCIALYIDFRFKKNPNYKQP